MSCLLSANYSSRRRCLCAVCDIKDVFDYICVAQNVERNATGVNVLFVSCFLLWQNENFSSHVLQSHRRRWKDGIYCLRFCLTSVSLASSSLVQFVLLQARRTRLSIFHKTRRSVEIVFTTCTKFLLLFHESVMYHHYWSTTRQLCCHLV